jgi:hypothetical protein
VIGGACFVLVFGTIAVLLPTIFHPAVNYAVLPVLQVIVLYLFKKRV